MDEGNLLWEPSAERIERATLTRYQRWVEETRGRRFDDYHDLWRWSVEDLDEFWRSIWEFFDVRSHGEWERALADASMPGAVWFPGARLNYAEHLFRGKRSDEVAIIHASELRELGEWTWARPARHHRRRGRRPARARRRPRRPRRRLPAEPARDDRRVPGVREPRRDLVVVLAGLRRAQRDRPLRPGRAQGAARGRRLPLQRPRLRPPRRHRAAAGRDAVARAHRGAAVPGSRTPTSPGSTRR